MPKISADTVRADFNDLTAVLHYTRAAHSLGLWASERIIIERTFTDHAAPLLEAGCGAGRVTMGLWELGYRDLTAFDFAEQLVDQARALAAERGAATIRFHHADATRLSQNNLTGYSSPPPSPGQSNPLGYSSAEPLPGESNPLGYSLAEETARETVAGKGPRAAQADGFAGALFMFNGLMQIPGRENRRAALREIGRLCRSGAPLLFTTHDRKSSSTERALWRLEAVRWERGEQDPRLVEFGDRYFEEDGTGRTFMHLPDRKEILEDLAAAGWTHASDCMRSHLARETKAVRDFSDECRFWVAHRA